jgi:GT2 family glycosyltransferase
MVSIIIPLFNQLDCTAQCLESIEAFTPEDHEIIFIDNGSTDGTEEWLKERLKPNYKLIRNNTNVGYTIACNQAAKLATGNEILFLNNDTVVSKEWLTGLLNALNSSSDIGCVGPMTNNISGRQQVNDPSTYDSIFKFVEFAENYRKAHKGLYVPNWRIVGFCLLVKRELFELLDGFDERFSPGNFEDDDFCLRLFREGFRNLIVADVFIHHHGSKSHDMNTFKDLLDTNKKKFDEKWSEIIKPEISAVVIVKDEEKNIKKMLDNIINLVHEIIIVDTGSTDFTKDIAKTYPKVKLYDFEWCDDFSKARNFANSKATKDWILSIDADETITGLDTLELNFNYVYLITTRNYNNNPRWYGNVENTGKYKEEAGLRWFPSSKVRLFPNDKRIAFQYPVHEVVEPSVYHLGIGVINCEEVIVHHYGRLNDDYEYGRGDKYLKLIQKQLESGMNDLRSMEQLALQMQAMRKFKEAREFWDKILVLVPQDNTALLNKGHCFAEEQNWIEALEWSRKAIEADPLSKEAQMNTATCEYMVGNREVAEKMCQDLLIKHPLYSLPQALLNAMTIKQEDK